VDEPGSNIHSGEQEISGLLVASNEVRLFLTRYAV